MAFCRSLAYVYLEEANPSVVLPPRANLTQERVDLLTLKIHEGNE